MISGLNVTDKTAMTDITFGALGQGEHFMHWGLGQWHFGVGIGSLSQDVFIGINHYVIYNE